MSVITLEGIVEHGQIRLKADVQLPDNIKVFVVIPDIEIQQSARILTPHLVHPEQAADFKLEIIEESPDANV
jgi:hypothetical protein